MPTSTYPVYWRPAWEDHPELGRLQEEVNQLFEAMGAGRPFLGPRERRFPLVNVTQNENESVLHAELPGVELKDLDITVNGTTLTLKGERKFDSSVPEEKYYRRERSAGPFGRSVELPHKVDLEKVEASLKDGVLTVRLPKAPEIKPRRIEVKS